jgi:hypothetical protein
MASKPKKLTLNKEKVKTVKTKTDVKGGYIKPGSPGGDISKAGDPAC